MWHPGGMGTESEITLGKWMKARGNRNDLVVATKVGFNRRDIGPSLAWQTIEAEVAGSLARLGADHIDLYYAHADIRQDPLEETLETFDALVAAGKVRALGCSNYRAWRIEQARDVSRSHGWVEYCCVQQRHTYLLPRPGASFGAQVSSNDALLDYCRENRDFRLLAYSRPDKKLPAQYAGAEAEVRLVALRQVAAESSATVNQVIYAWMLQGDPAVIPLTAPTSLDQLHENLKALDVRLAADQLQRLDAAGRP